MLYARTVVKEGYSDEHKFIHIHEKHDKDWLITYK